MNDYTGIARHGDQHANNTAHGPRLVTASNGVELDNTTGSVPLPGSKDMTERVMSAVAVRLE